ncbi:MAG: threonylcarbamoyl-AMP synthase [SAR202 cluster bacterium]|nr:threonylcarbamoyl-AMP synthase [SAR202 cluster bacterium]
MNALASTRKASGPPSGQVSAAVEVLKQGGVVAVPTDTLYGLAANALNEVAVRRVFAVKGRPEGMALPVLIADTEDLAKFAVDVPEAAWKLARRFWPGPLTLVLRKADVIPSIVTGGADTVGLRVPAADLVRQIVRELGAPVTGTSANRTGKPGLTTADDVMAELGGLVDLVLDIGPITSDYQGAASTIIDMLSQPPLILREGPVSTEDIGEQCGVAVVKFAGA